MERHNFNDSWNFYRVGEEEKCVMLDLPHDAMIEEERIPDLVGGDNSAFFPGGKYVYEKKFFVSLDTGRDEVILSFDGVYQKAVVYVNGFKAGEQIQGYTNFQVKITDFLKKDQSNVVKVTVDNTQVPNSRWYTGSGIYRDVTLYTGNRVHIRPGGIRVDTLGISPVILKIFVETDGKPPDSRDKKVNFKVTDSKGAELKLKILNLCWENDICIVTAEMETAELWTEEHPILYSLEAQLVTEAGSDYAKGTFGIRTLRWTPKKGLEINGNTIKLRGACIHHDNGILGAREYREIAFRKIQILRECGYNAIRTAHNEPSEVILEACDELGMYVLAEFTDVWRGAKNEYDYSLYFDRCAEHDLKQMIHKCAVHPSVIMYSLGNEVYDTKSTEAQKTCAFLAQIIREKDGTRPITMGFNILGACCPPKNKPLSPLKHSPDEIVDPKRRGNKSPLVSSKLMNMIVMHLPWLMDRVTPEKLENNEKCLLDVLDIAGLNYGTHLYSVHDINPERIIVNTETFPAKIGKTWPDTVSHSWIVGDFMWTGWDYLGECGIGVVEYGKTPLRLNKPYPCISGGTGSINLVGEIEAQGWYTKTVYGLMENPYIGVHPVTHAGKKVKKSAWRGTDAVNSWAWGQDYGKQTTVEVYSKYFYVELWQNGMNLGRKKTVECRADFIVEYKAGYLEAVAFDSQGREKGRSRLESDDNSTYLHLYAEKKQLRCGSLTYIFAEITDVKGRRKTSEERDICFKVTGEGKLLGVGSGNPWTRYPFTGEKARTWFGSAAAVVQAGKSPGNIYIHACSKEHKTRLEIQVTGESLSKKMKL